MMSDGVENLTEDQKAQIARFVNLGYQELANKHKDFKCRKCWKAGGLVLRITVMIYMMTRYFVVSFVMMVGLLRERIHE